MCASEIINGPFTSVFSEGAVRVFLPVGPVDAVGAGGDGVGWVAGVLLLLGYRKMGEQDENYDREIEAEANRERHIVGSGF